MLGGIRQSGTYLQRLMMKICKYHKLGRPSFSGTGSAVIVVAFRRPLRSAYFLAVPAIPPHSLKNQFSLSGRWRQPEAYFRAWVHRLFVRLSSATADASINILIGCEFLRIDKCMRLAIRRVAFLAFRLERTSR
jgi:hypothetical protein